MCGIAGIVSRKGDDKIYEKTQLMAQKIKHRGPDDEECVSFNNHVSLAHVRLSILDVSSKGHQPMYSCNRKFCIVYNGEIYNYIELRKYIEINYGSIAWRSNCDTEVIVEGYSLEGRKFIEKLNGIFAMAIYDLEKSEVFLSRDSAGVKPLYYCEQAGNLYFASELKALAVMNLSLSLRKQSLQDQLIFMYVPEPYTLYNECFKFSAGEYKIFRNGELNEQGKLDNSYFHHDYVFTTEVEAQERLDELLKKAVRRQLISDVPVSLFLSGGLDSSLVTALSYHNGADIKDAYTISFNESDLKKETGGKGDLDYAKIIADRFKINLKVIEAHPNMLEFLPETVYFLDDALSDPAAINSYLICESARKEGIKVMLSGQGADEIFGGYRKYRALNMFHQFPKPLARLVKPMVDIIPFVSNGYFNTKIRRSRKFLENAVKDIEDQQVGLAFWSTPEVIYSLFVDGNRNGEIGQVHYKTLKAYKELDPMKQMMRLDEDIYLTSHNLMYTDRMSMMAGVEARVPFLDFELVDFAHQLPPNMLISHTEQKYLLKKVSEKYLPSEVIYRSKSGFGSPIRSWFLHRNELADKYFDKNHLLKQGIFNPNVVEKIYLEQLKGKGDNAYLLYALLSFQLWYDINIDKNIKF